MSGHWVFGIKYAEGVLKLPLLVFTENVSEIQSKLRKISWAVWTLNGSFVTLIFTFTLLLQLYTLKVLEDNNIVSTWLNRLIIAIFLSPTVLLLVAVIRFAAW